MKKKVYYSLADYNSEEIKSVNHVLKNNSLNLVNGKNVKKFEDKILKLFGKRYGLMVNSGSSANLLALASLNLKPGAEVITPSLTFSTTVSPILQLNLIPVFVDIEKNKYLADVNQIESLISKKTKAIMIPNLLGNIANWPKLRRIAKKFNLFLIEDSADTLGYKINNKIEGRFSDIVTSSFYASHIITGAGFGGIVCFNNKKLYEKAKIMRGWGRLSAVLDKTETNKKRFSYKINSVFYDSSYYFTELGYNFLPSEISAAFGLSQLKKLKKRLSDRKKNFQILLNYFKKNLNDYLHLPLQQENTDSAWLAFPIVLKSKKKNIRKKFQIFLEKKNIQTRTIFSGDITKQPFMKNKNFILKKGMNYNTNLVMNNGVLLGCHQLLTKQQIDYVCNNILFFINKNIK